MTNVGNRIFLKALTNCSQRREQTEKAAVEIARMKQKRFSCLQ
jgi:hypothetical protein